MQPITIKLLHERRTRHGFRKVDGSSGKLYPFTWSDVHKHYCFTTSVQAEADDIFLSQGRNGGSTFAPVLVEETAAEKPKPAPLPEEVSIRMLSRGLTLPPADASPERIGVELIAAYENGRKSAVTIDPGVRNLAATPPVPAPASTAPDLAAEIAAPEPQPVTKAKPKRAT